MNEIEINAKVAALDLTNLSAADIAWLHELKTLAQRLNNAMFYKELGLTGDAIKKWGQS